MYDFIVKQGNGVKGLIDSGLSVVPDLYIQPEHERIHKTTANAHGDGDGDVVLPLIDISQLDGPDPDHDQAAESLVKAAERFGFFYVVNHGLAVEFLEELKDAAHEFFNQPAKKKAIYLKGVSTSPLVNYGTSFVPEKEKTFEWKDYCTMIYTGDDDALKHWPDQFKELALKYLKTSTIIAERILKVLLGNLGVTVDESMVEAYMGSKVVNINYYPTCPDPGSTVGIGRHSDIGVLTVLLQDGIGGLFIRVEEQDGDVGKKGEWIEIPPVPGALLINIADTLQVLSNGRYKSAEHQVRTNNLQSRVSIPFFLNPRATIRIRPLPQVVERDGEARYREYLYDDYKKYFFSQAFQGKKTIDFAKIVAP